MVSDTDYTADILDIAERAKLIEPDSFGRSFATHRISCDNECLVGRLEVAAHELDDPRPYSYPYSVFHGLNLYETDRYRTAEETSAAINRIIADHEELCR